MPKTEPFEKLTQRYEEWFEKHEYVYRSELEAIKPYISEGRRLEIGVGSGQFASPLGIRYGLDPSGEMIEIARERGIEVVRGVAEKLPFGDESFDSLLIVTTICFVDDVQATVGEAYRVLKPHGNLVIGFIDKNSPLGKVYQEKQEENPFYRDAQFLSMEDVTDNLESAGFSSSKFEFTQTIFRSMNEIESSEEVEPVKEGYGEGSFVAVSAEK